MGFRKDFLWGGATAANQCEGGYDEGGRGLANVDVVPIGKDRFPVITGKKKMFEFDEDHFYPAKLQSICIIVIKKILLCLQKWGSRLIECPSPGVVFFQWGMRKSRMKLA